jgi:hypothetical protein
MAFDLRCPSCQSKLRLDEAPKPRSAVECPKCGESFAAPARPPAPKEAPKADKPKAKAGAEDTKPATGEKVSSKDRVHMNEYALLGIVGGVVLVFGLILGVILWYLGKAAKVEDLVAMLPSDCNIVRGVNYAQMKKYPGYKSELDKHYKGELQAAFEELNTAAGQKGADEWLNYFLLGRQYFPNGGENRVLLFNMKLPFDTAAAATAMKGEAQDADGQKFWLLPARRGNQYLDTALLYFPNDTTAMLFKNRVLTTGGRRVLSAQTLLKSAMGYQSEAREERLNTKFGAAGKLAFRGHIWQVIRPTGELKGYLTDLAAPIAKDSGLGKVSETSKNSSAMGLWVTIGGRGVRIAAALECASADEASALVKAMQEGPLGKGDESEIPNGMKAAIPSSNQKEFKEFLQNLSFRSKNEAAYLLSKMETGPEKARPILELFNKEVLDNPNQGGFGGPGLPGGPGR